MRRVSSYLSKKIAFISFVYSVLIVALHAYCISMFDLDLMNNVVDRSAWYIQKIVVQDISRCCVPTFFMISGFLFFVNAETMKDVWVKMKKRAFSLLIPFLVYNILYFGWSYFVEVLINGTSFESFWNFERGLINNIIHIVFVFEYNAVAWYVFVLLGFTAISPILYLTLKNIYISLFTLALFFAIGCIEVIPVLPGRNYVIFFLYLGAFAGRYLLPLLNSPTAFKNKKWPVWIALSMLIASQWIILKFGFYDQIANMYPVRFAFEILISIALWFLLDLIRIPEKKWFYAYSFPIYMVHPALLSLSKSILQKTSVGNYGGRGCILTYVLLIFGTTGLIIISFHVLRDRNRTLYAVLSGGR